MFKKRPQIKNLSPLKSSERRRLADQIRKDYALPEPQAETETLTGLRNALLPDPTSSAKFTTTHGPKSTLVSGTIYVGAHPGQEERILWFQIGKDDRLIPTVYSLWQNPGLLPLLHIGEMIVSKLQGGADLFAPGLIQPEQGYDERAKKESIVAVAGHKTDTVPRWVGIAKVDITSLAGNATGAAAEGLHWEGDELWSWSALNKGGMAGPDTIRGWKGLSSIEDGMNTMALEDDEAEDEQVEGGVSLSTGQSDAAASGDAVGGEEDQEPDHIPTTEEVDDAFYQAFLYAIYDAKKTHAAEPHGLDLPIQPSFLVSKMINPYLRHPQSPHYNIKKTSWKNTKKFIKHLDKQVLVKSKDRNGGETVIVDIDFKDQAIKSFQPYHLPKAKTDHADDTSGGNGNSESGKDTSLGQRLTLQTLYRVSSKLVPELVPSKTAFCTAAQITTALKSYIEANASDLLNDSRKRYVKLNPFIANNILGSNPSSDDSKAFAAGEIDRGALQRRILEDDHLCVPYWLLLRNDQTYDPSSPDPSLKPKAGTAPKVKLTIEKRGGNKVVTAIVGLEAFGINPQVIRPELQKKCAGSASVGQHLAGKPGALEVTVQGDQRVVVEKEVLGRRGVKPEWVEVEDKSKKKKK